uniref:Monodehydroascorbate reductase n=1 Tax=Tanacetum cinerariifolium TaxID=118510 RepID=A0A6L2N954_TANCI|nr:hypothetical protein [Tanacetum cinerariifolium]
MATTIEQQVALDEALAPSAQRLRIGQSNFRLPSDIQSNEPTLQVATAKVHQHSIRFKMDTKTHIFDLESFREMLHISPRVLGQYFAELPFEEEILEFLRFLRHSAQIKTLTDVNVNKLYQPWRSFAAVINKCLTGKSTGFDSLRLSQAQILWGLYHKRNVDYAFLIWEDLVYQVEHKNQKKSNEMYYPRFTKVIIHYFMTKKPSIPRRNRVNWHYVGDDILFSTIKVVSRHQNTQQYGVILPIELTTKYIRNTKAYKEYYACATREVAPKPKASAKKKKGGSASSTTPPTPIATPTPTTTIVAAPRLTAVAKGKQPARARSPTEPSDVKRTEAEQLKIVLRRSRQETHISQQRSFSTDEGTGSKSGVPDVPTDDSEEELSWNSSDDEDVGEQTKGRDKSEGEKTDESDDDDDQEEAEKVNDDNDDEEEVPNIDEQETTESGEGDDEATKSDRDSEDEETREQEEESFDPNPQTLEESEDDDNNEEDQGLRIGEEERMHEEEEADELYRDVDIKQGRGLQVSQVIKESHVTLSLTHSDAQQESSSTSSFMTNLLNPTMDLDRVKSLEVNFSNILGIVDQYMHQQMPKAIREAKIIKEQVKTQVKAQITRILPRIEESMNAQLEAEVLTRSSHSSRTSYAVAANLSEMELKKILIDKMEGNKSIQRSDEQWNLYKALVKAYDVDKTILNTYGESAILKRRREDDDQEGPSAGSDRGSTTETQSRQLSASESAFAEEPVQTTYQMEEPSHPVVETGAEDQPIVQTSQHPEWFSQPSKPPTPDRDWNKSLPATQGEAQSWISALAKQTDACSSFNELLDTPIDFSNFIMNRLGVDTLTLKLLVDPTYELMRGSCKSLIELEYHLEEVYKAMTDQLDWVNPEGQQYPHNLLQPLPLIPDNRGRRVIPFEHFINNDLEYLQGELVPRAMWIQEPINYDKHALWGVSHWGRKRQQFYGFAINRESALDVYSKRRIIAITNLKIVEWHNYKHLDWISVRRDDDKIYKFKEGDFKRLRRQDIKDMLLLLVQGKLSNLTVEERCSRDKDRAAAMLQAIDKMLKTQRIMRSLERRVSLMLEILSRRFFLKLNLSDHRSILTDLQGTLKGKWRYLIPTIPPIHNHECSRPNHSDHDSNDSISSISAPASKSRDTIVIDCTRQEDFPSVCTSSIETDVKSSNTFYVHLIKDCDLHEQRLVKRNVEGKGKLGKRPTGKPVNLNRPKPVSAEHAEVYYKCMEPFQSLMRLWVRNKSIAAIWLEKVVTPLIDPTIKIEFRRISLIGFRSCTSRSQTGASQVDKTRLISLDLDSISALLLFGDRRLERTATFSISTISE